jgi:hypothetical protein
VKLDSLAAVLGLALPLAALGFLAGGLRAASLRAREPRTRRLLQLAWVATLLVGGPLWLFLAATLRIR